MVGDFSRRKGLPHVALKTGSDIIVRRARKDQRVRCLLRLGRWSDFRNRAGASSDSRKKRTSTGYRL